MGSSFIIQLFLEFPIRKITNRILLLRFHCSSVFCLPFGGIWTKQWYSWLRRYYCHYNKCKLKTVKYKSVSHTKGSILFSFTKILNKKYIVLYLLRWCEILRVQSQFTIDWFFIDNIQVYGSPFWIQNTRFFFEFAISLYDSCRLIFITGNVSILGKELNLFFDA